MKFFFSFSGAFSSDGDETGGSDHQGSAISSSVIITMEPSTNEAAASSEASASTKRKPTFFESRLVEKFVGKKKYFRTENKFFPNFSETSAHKRSRAASPEQVSTSDPSTSGMPTSSAVVEQINLEVEDQSGAAKKVQTFFILVKKIVPFTFLAVGSSLDEDVMILEPDEPDQSSNNGGDSQVVGNASRNGEFDRKSKKETNNSL